MSQERVKIGKKGEQLAYEYILRQGYTVLERNFRCKLGEIDLIAGDRNMVVFLEVRTKSSTACGPAYNSVTPRKQQHVKRTALFYIAQRNLVNTQFRFDVIGITLNLSNGTHTLDHIQNAFC
ncbi:YraN family protein [candidate division KSB3 bacterium]|uniref:UPF0102 protein CSB45_02995 n=1 Tax=candidate division KSB3 bacterium TaxID=2044937 RepID=A0A2G6E8Y4_9BACT|nr:MAG: YraN family protein [candidate division KSB3 bacterium]